MSYTKHNYKKGDELLASQLNDMDDQIALNEQTADTLVTVSNTQPASTKNRVWVKATPSEIEIPTMDDHNELSRQLSDTKSAITQITGDVAPNAAIVNGLYINTSGKLASFSSGESNRTICVQGKPNRTYIVKKATSTIMRVGCGASSTLGNNAQLSRYTAHSTASANALTIVTDDINVYIYIQLFADSDSANVKTIEANTATLTICDNLEIEADNTQKEVDELTSIVGKSHTIDEFTANKAFTIGEIGATSSLVFGNSGVGNYALAFPLLKGEILFITAKSYSGRGTLGILDSNCKVLAKFDAPNELIYSVESDGYAIVTTYPEWFGYIKLITPATFNGIEKSIYCPYPQLPADGTSGSDFDGDNMTAQDVYDYIDTIVAKYPNMAKRELLGNDATNTLPIYRYIIGDRGKTDYLATIFIAANEHGPTSDPRECAIVSARLIKDICEAYAKTNDFLNVLKAHFRFVIIPVANPWGFNNNSRNNGNNVNINRNYNTPGWSEQADADKGSSAGSEVETQYIMQTITDYNAEIALDLHCLGYGNSANDNKCHYSGKIEDKVAINKISKSMKRDYNLDCTSYGQGNYNVSATGDSYFNYIGIHGLLLEFNAREGATADTGTALHSASIVEADYTFMLRILNMLIDDYNPAYSIEKFR